MSLYIKDLPFALKKGMILEQKGIRFKITSVSERAGTFRFMHETGDQEYEHLASDINVSGNEELRVTMPDLYVPALGFTIKEYVKCQDCGNYFPKNGNTRWYTGEPLCNDCFENGGYAECNICGEVHQTVYMDFVDDRYICAACFENNYCRCTCCNEVIRLDHANWINDESYCDSCAREYGTCDRCGYQTHSDSLSRNCHGEYICEDCWDSDEDEEDNYLHQHWSKLPVKFHDNRDVHHTSPISDTTMYYGMELEMETCGADRNVVVEAICDDTEDDYYLEHDGSLCDGIEVIAHARTFESWDKFWGEFDKRVLRPAISYGCKGHSPGTCGIHIHTSLSAWEGDQLFRLFGLLYDKEAYRDILTISQRKEHNLQHWASLDVADIGQYRKKIVDKSNPFDERYAALNMTHSTLEFRLFNSSLRIDRVRKNMEFVRALYLYTSGQKSVSWNGFKLWIKRHKDIVPFLYNFMVEKNLFTAVIMEQVQNIDDMYVEEAA